MRKLKIGIWVLFCVFIYLPVAFADVIYLKNGKKIEGKVVEETEEKVRIDLGFGAYTYFSKEIEKIERDVVLQPQPTTLSQPPDSAKLVDSIAREIARLRNFSPAAEIKEGIKSKAELKKYIINNLIDSRQDLVSEGKVLIKLGLLPSYVNYTEMVIQSFTHNIGGYYDPKEKTLFMTEGIPKAQQEFILAHEISHFFQDKSIDLEAFSKNKNNDDLIMAHNAVIEGEAFALAMDYSLREKNVEFTAVTDYFVSLYSMYMGFSLETNIISLLYSFPYFQGLAFLREVRLLHPWTYMNEIYKNPPSSTEQIIHPEKYLKEKDEPVSIKLSDVSSLLGGSWKKIYENTLGELMYSLILGRSGDLAVLGSEGWDGDRMLCYENTDSGKLALIQLSTWDSFQDAKEFLWAYNEVIKNKYLEEKAVDAKEANCLVWDTEEGIALVEIREKNVLIIEGLPNYELCLKVRQSIWNDAEREGLITTKEISNLEKLKLTAEDFYRKGKEFLEEWVPNNVTPYFLSKAGFYLKKAIELDEGFLEAYPLLARVTVARNYTGKDFDEEGARQAFYYIDKAEKINPDFAQLHWAKAHAYRALKRDETALEEINKAINQDPNNPEYHISLGMIYNYSEQKNYPKAIETFNKALSFKPTKAQEARIYVYLTDAYQGSSQHKEGVEIIKKFLNLGYISPEILNGLAYSLGKIGRYDEAIEAQKKSLRYEEALLAHTRLGALYSWKEMYEEAEKEYLHANDKKYLENLVNRYRTKGWFDKADKLLKKMKKEDVPVMLQGVEGYVNKGILDYEQGNLESAMDNFVTALEIDTTYSPAYVYLAEIYEIKKDKAKADEFYKKAETVDAKRAAEAYYRLGDIYANTKGNHLKAIQLFRKAVELNPEYADAYYGLGRTSAFYVYNHGKDYTESVSAFKKALELGLENCDVYYGLGAAYYEWGKYNDAKFYFKKSLDLKPDNSHAKHYLEECEKRIRR